MIAATIKTRWNPRPFDRLLHRHLAHNRRRAGEHYKDAIQEATTRTMGTDNRGDFITKFVGGMPVSVRVRWGTPYIHSKPGDLPYWVTEETANSWEVAHDPTVTTVLSTSPVSRWLETGTTRMAPRPHIIPTLFAESAAMLRIWATPI
jgi:hypothetical protein